VRQEVGGPGYGDGVARGAADQVVGGHGELVGKAQVAVQPGQRRSRTTLEVAGPVGEALGQMVHEVTPCAGATGPGRGSRGEAGRCPEPQPLHQ